MKSVLWMNAASSWIMMHAKDTRPITGEQSKGGGLAFSKVAIMRLMLVMVIIIVPIIYYAGHRVWTMKANSQQPSLTDKLIQQRNDISRRLNKLQVWTFVRMFSTAVVNNDKCFSTSFWTKLVLIFFLNMCHVLSKRRLRLCLYIRAYSLLLKESCSAAMWVVTFINVEATCYTLIPESK